ncbi:putative 3-hydroxyisobutyrate dehydrogenase [Advenella mimigardefordensis DPN7]|uniref:Putative 3-hydroxyisobutyrate dehydrogenase n=1 Tax=Advenella mimigardefordensis (strain DSM 17166 / LMG 22922 / DPN7) TaxID=1247726 RepID=W0PJ63_ADVMD|nr:putative 3-hydroxyisobutyrate dehydrogenase [Advenella mimigardefordensis DPN7]
MNSQKIGFIGLGRMGLPMMTNLLRSGWQVHVFDTSADACSAAQALGAIVEQSVQAVADSAETVMLSLPTPAIVESVLSQLVNGKQVSRVIDLSTIGIRAARRAQEIVSKHDIHWIEAPVSGGVTGASAGTLTLMVSCPAVLREAIEPVLRALGTVMYAGEAPGLAQAAKLANNMLSAAALVASSEAISMAVKAGVEPTALLGIINSSSGRNTATTHKIPNEVLSRRFQVGFANKLSHKDVTLCIEEAASMGIPMPVSVAIREMLAITTATFGDNADISDVARVLEQWSGITIEDKAA